jgi:hypothetical protein
MGPEIESRNDATPTFDGELAAPPRGPFLTGILAITGALLLLEMARLIARYVLALRRPVEVRLTPNGLELSGRTLMVGKLLREHRSVILREGLVRVTRDVRYPSLPMYAGLFALALGSYVGVGLMVDGARAASPSMLGTGLLIAVFGIGLDFVLTSLVPGLKGKARVVVVPRRGSILCITLVKPAQADALLTELAKETARASGSPRAAVEGVTADHAANESERKSAGESR